MNFKAQPCIDITRSNIHYDITCSATKQQNISQTRDWQRYSVSCPNGRAMGCLLWAFVLGNSSRYNVTALTQTLSCHSLLANYIAVAMLSKIRPGTTNTRQYIVMILHTAMQWQKQTTDQTFNSQKIPDNISPSWTGYGVSVVFWNKPVAL